MPPGVRRPAGVRAVTMTRPMLRLGTGPPWQRRAGEAGLVVRGGPGLPASPRTTRTFSCPAGSRPGSTPDRGTSARRLSAVAASRAGRPLAYVSRPPGSSRPFDSGAIDA